MRKRKCKQCTEYFEKQEETIEAFGSKFCSKSCRLKFIQAKNRREKEKQLKRLKKEKVETKRKDKIKKKKEKKQNSVSFLKKKLWTIISLYIRLRDSNDDNNCTCCTCGETRHYKDSMQAGHYIPSGSSSFHRYNDRNIHPQCYGCNVGKGGNLIEYRPFMIKKHGQTYVDWLYDSRNTITSLGSMEIKELIEQYTIKLNKVKEKKALD